MISLRSVKKSDFRLLQALVAEVAKTYMTDISPLLSISSVLQRWSYLNAHLLPRFGTMAIVAIDIPPAAIRNRLLCHGLT